MWPKYNKPFFFHIRDTETSEYKGITACAVPTGLGDVNFKLGFSLCDKSDNFNKRMGRRIAEGRAHKYGHNTLVSATDLAELKKVVQEEATLVINNAMHLRKERRERLAK